MKRAYINRYGMKFSTIKYWQESAWRLWRTHGIVAGSGTFLLSRDVRLTPLNVDPRHIAHDAIMCAAVLSTAHLVHLLQTGERI